MGSEISQNESNRESEDRSTLHGDIQIQESQNTSVITAKQIPTEDIIESPNAIVSAGNEVLKEGKKEIEDLEPETSKGVHSEIRGTKLEGEQVPEEPAKEPLQEDTERTPLSALLQRSNKEAPQVIEHVTKERELTASPEEIASEEEGEENSGTREVKTGQEYDGQDEGDEHKKTDSSSDSLVVVDAAKDIDMKLVHKKPHGILSGVGSKVKHSISKVKKAITGKSSHHLKPASPK